MIYNTPHRNLKQTDTIQESKETGQKTNNDLQHTTQKPKTDRQNTRVKRNRTKDKQ